MSENSVPRIITDTNVLVSGIIAPGGYPDQVLSAWFNRQAALVMAQRLFEEALEVLARERIARLYQRFPYHREQVIRNLQLAAEWVVPLDEGSLPVHARDRKDDRFLAAALAAHVDFLITGDDDLLVLDGHPALPPTRIVTPRRFMELLRPPTA